MVELKINNSVVVQNDFWGNGAVYHGYAGMPDSDGRVYSDELCGIEVNRASDMKLKIARTFYKWWAWDEKTNTWDWDNHIMTAFYRWLKSMKDANIMVALNTGWCCPGDIDSSSWNGKSPFTVQGDWEKSVQNYANWVSETVHQLIEIRGFTNIKILVMFTEPNHGFGKIEFYKLWAEAVKAAHEALIRDGRRDMVKLMGSNEGSGVTSEMLEWVSENEKVKDIIDIYSSHTYQNIANIPKKYIKTGKTSVSMSLAGGRIAQTVKIKPNTEYNLFVDLLFHKTNPMLSKGNIYFGLFVDDGRNDIHKISGSGPAASACDESTCAVSVKELTEDFKRYEISFNSGKTTSGVIGIFHDIKTPGLSVVDQIVLRESGQDTSVNVNGNFENDYQGWKLLFAGGTSDSYFDWYRWAKTGVNFAKGKPFCFDEYNVIYDRDNSRPSHGAEVVTAAIAMMNAGVQSSLLWTLFDQQWPNNHTTNGDSFYNGDHRCGVMPILTRSLVPHLSYYAFSLLSKYVDGKGTKVYEGFGGNCIHTTMSVSKEGDITIVVVNNKDIADEYKILLDKPINATLYRHSFDPVKCIPNENPKIIGVDKTFDNIKSDIVDNIAPYSVTIYTTHVD